ncbi:MAG: serine/threonine-protein phosphatase [Gemmatimonadetes bacterium]|nr:serine/threonine-protein phosphatase [Gemmatimonadota bacterium]
MSMLSSLRPARVDAASVSHIGMVRETNQDQALAIQFAAGGPSGDREAHAALIVCDGMGGRVGGEVASAIVCGVVRDALAAWRPDFDMLGAEWQQHATEFLHAVIAHANTEVLRVAGEQPDTLKGMGSTLALALLVRDWCGVVTVGDSRVYRLRAGLLQQLSIDHSWAEEQRATGAMTEAEIHESPYAAQLMRVIGYRDDVSPDVRWTPSLPGDLLLVCSDGLTHHLDPNNLQYVLRREGDVKKLAEQLVNEANTRGGDDNIGLVLARVPEKFVARLADPDMGRTRRPLRNNAEVRRRTQLPLVIIGSALVVVMGVLTWAVGAMLEWW